MPEKKRGLDQEAKRYAARLESARLAMGLTQEQMAQGLGITVSTYRSYEKGRSRIPLEFIPKLAEITGRSIYYFHGVPDPRGLDGDEQTLISLWRKLRPTARRAVLDLARTFARESQNTPEMQQ